MKSASGIAFLLLVFFACLFRFGWPHFLFFTEDEGMLQLIADKALDTGNWPTLGLVGTAGLPYGPVASWFYIALRTLLPQPNLPDSGLFWMTAILHGGSILCLLGSLFRFFQVSTFVAVASLILTSPFLLYYSRFPWDNTFLIVFGNSFAALLLFSLSRKSYGRSFLFFCWALFGLLSALSWGTHLMSTPLVCGMLLAGLFLSRSRSEALIGSCIFVGVFLLISYPYINAVIHWTPPIAEPPKPFALSRLLTGTRSILFVGSGWLSWEQFAAYYTGQLSHLLHDKMSDLSGGMTTFLRWPTQGAHLAWALVMVAMPLALWRKQLWFLESKKVTLLLVITSISFLHLAMALIKDTTTYPHYFQAIWWIPFVFMALVLESVSSANRHRLVFLIFTTVALNAIAIPFMAAAFYQAQGFPNLYLGAVLPEKRRAIEDLCQKNVDKTAIAYDDGFAPNEHYRAPFQYYPMKWVFTHTASCRGKILTQRTAGPRWLVYTKGGMDATIHWRYVEQ